MVYAQPRICPGEWDAETPLGFWDTNDHLMSARWSDIIIIKKNERTCWIMDFAVPADHRVKLKNAKREISTSTLRGNWKKNLRNMKVAIIPIIIGALGTVTKGLLQGLEDWEKNGTGGDCSNYRIVEFGQNTAKSPGYLRRLAANQSPVESHQVTLMWKTPKCF